MDEFRGVSSPTYVSLLCCGCATSTIPVAEIMRLATFGTYPRYFNYVEAVYTE